MCIRDRDWVADYISKYQITYPVAFDCEGFTDSASRQYGLSLIHILYDSDEELITDAFFTLKHYVSGDEEVSKDEWMYFLECLAG